MPSFYTKKINKNILINNMIMQWQENVEIGTSKRKI
jgi:hypothetical protein